MKWIVPLLLILSVATCWIHADQKAARELELTAAEPEQTYVIAADSFSYGDYLIKPLADYAATVRVLNTKRYENDREAELAPIDFVFGWGVMADPQVLGDISITQSGRWYRWQYQTASVSPSEIAQSSSNVHLIPADEEVLTTLYAVEKNDIVQIKGQLVQVSGKNGYHWSSSLSRTDQGAGACEVLWVESLTIL